MEIKSDSLSRCTLQRESIRRFMETNPVTVSPSVTLAQLAEEYIYRYHFKMFPVVKDGKLIGGVTTRQVKDIPREKWEQTKVEDILTTCSTENILSSKDDAIKALTLMRKTDNSRLMVVDGGNLVGIVTLKDMLQFLSLKMDLEDDEFKE